MGTRRYITFKVEDDLPGASSLRSQGRAREPLAVRCGRCMRFCGFCCVCTGTLFQALAPWMLSVIEAGTLLLLLLLLILPYRPPGPYSFDFHSSLEDVVLLGGVRAAALASTYAYGSSSLQLRPYLYTSYVGGGVGLVYVAVKACLYSYPLAWPPPAVLMITFATFSWLHILAARYTVTWYRRRGQLGLISPWHTGSSSRRSMSAAASPAWLGDSSADVSPELLADFDSQFLDVDGLVVHYKEATPARHSPLQPLAALGEGSGAPLILGHLSDHHFAPQQQQQQQPTPAEAVLLPAARTAMAAGHKQCLVPSDVGVVLVHGFGGGVFAWRHLLQPLADAVGVRVVAFDRPGFGLTARPELREYSSSGLDRSNSGSSRTQPLLPTEQPDQQQQQQQQQQQHTSNPYSIEAQAQLTLRMCELLGLKQVLLLSHADGCIAAVHAAAAALLSAGRPSLNVPPAGSGQQLAGRSAGSSSCGLEGQGSRGGSAASSLSFRPMLAAQHSRSHHSLTTSPTDSADGTGNTTEHRATGEQQSAAVGAISSGSRGLEAGHVAATSNAGRPHLCRSSSSIVSNKSSVQVCGLGLLHPSLSGHQIPAYTRLLSASVLGRSMLKPLLRSEANMVTNRRAWAHPELLTREVLSLYERPLRVEGWDAALLASCRAAAATSPSQVAAQFAVARHLPVLLVTGEFDRIVTPATIAAVAEILCQVQHAVVLNCGHLSHEEAPERLLQLLVPFCRQHLAATA